MEIYKIDISKIKREVTNSREDLGDLEGLMESMGSTGQQTPIGVLSEGHYSYTLVYGFRRLAAAKALGWESITARVYSFLNETAQLELNLQENVARKDLSPIEEARALKRVLDAGGELEAIRKSLGWSKTIITQRLALLDMSPQVQEALGTNEISVGQARAITNAPEERQQELIEMAKEGATMRALKQEVEAINELSGAFYVEEPQITPDTEDDQAPVFEEETPQQVADLIETEQEESSLAFTSSSIKQGLLNLAASTVICDDRFLAVIGAIKNIDFTALSVNDLTSFSEVIEEVSDGSWGEFNRRTQNEPSINHKKH